MMTLQLLLLSPFFSHPPRATTAGNSSLLLLVAVALSPGERLLFPPLAENAHDYRERGEEKEEDEAALSLISPVAESGLLGLARRGRGNGKDNGSSSFPFPLSSPLLSICDFD